MTTTMNSKLVGTAIAAMVVTCAFAPPAAAQTVAGAFSKGRVHFFVGGGPGQAFDESYFVLSLGASYYLIDGLALGLSYETWTGGDPSMYKITPSVTYVFHQAALKPYVGGFFRRTSIEDRPDLDSVGARAGVYFQAGRNAYFGVGGVYESYLDCNENTLPLLRQHLRRSDSYLRVLVEREANAVAAEKVSVVGERPRGFAAAPRHARAGCGWPGVESGDECC